MVLYSVKNFIVPADFTLDQLKSFFMKKFQIKNDDLLQFKVTKSSIDARKKNQLKKVLQLEVGFEESLKRSPKEFIEIEKSALDIARPECFPLKISRNQNKKVIIVGSGPAGLFAALVLSEAGVLVSLYERGKPVETRMQDIGKLRAKGILYSESNICFGEGGAGTYTDGKLYSRVKHPFLKWAFRRLVDFGGPENILIDAHPHLGTDKLVNIIKNMREHLQKNKAVFHFDSKAEKLLIEDNEMQGIISQGKEEKGIVVLGIGHSARDTFRELVKQGVAMEAKDFAVGFRVEHLQSDINKNQYGKDSIAKYLGAASYRLTHECRMEETKRGVYSFCMCPGGFIVPSPTQEGRMAINGMSNSNRSTAYANSGIVTQILCEDLTNHGYEKNPLMGIDFQEDLEALTFEAAEKTYKAPAMNIKDFVDKTFDRNLNESNFRPGMKRVNFWEVYPNWILEPIRTGILNFNKKIKGFASEKANILAIESRTSSPVRIIRDDQGMDSISFKNLYPIGEGAGYAGGIMSAAVDGLRAAEAILKKYYI